MRIVNLTPHSITFVDDAGNTVLTVEPSGQIARCSVVREKVGTIAGIPVTNPGLGKWKTFPNRKRGQYMSCPPLPLRQYQSEKTYTSRMTRSVMSRDE